MPQTAPLLKLSLGDPTGLQIPSRNDGWSECSKQLDRGGHVPQGVMSFGGVKRHAKVRAQRRQLKIRRRTFAGDRKPPQGELQGAKELSFGGQVDA